MNIEIKRGDVYLVQLDPSIGFELQKARPCLVISNNVFNQTKLITVLPITSQNVERIRKSEVFIPIGYAGLEKSSKVLTQQIRTVDKTQVLKFIGSVDSLFMSKVNEAIKIHLSMDEFDTD